MKLAKKIVKIVISAFSSIIFIISIVLLLFGLIQQGKKERFTIFGYSYSVVATSSMEPTIKVGDIIIAVDAKKVAIDAIEKGDIIIFYSSELDIYITHRVEEVKDGMLITKGDNNPSADYLPVTIDNYYGKVIRYGSFLGLGRLILNYRNLAFVFVVIIFILIILNEIISIIRVAREEKQKELNAEKLRLYNEEREKLKVELRKEFFEKNERES